MKRLICVLLSLVVTIQLYASEELDLYTWLFDQSASVHEQYSVIKTVSSLNIPDSGSLYASALAKLNSFYMDLKTHSERNSANALAKLLVMELGSLKYESAADDIWRISQVTTDPATKGEAMTALGRIRSMAYLPQLIKTLNDLNLRAPVNRSDAEKVAYGTIMGLEKYRLPEVYEPIFFAANGWYSTPVKDLAIQVLPSVVDDPTEPLRGIMNRGSYEVKLLALEASFASQAPNASKTALAVYAFSDGWIHGSSRLPDRALLSRYRKTAMNQLASLGVPDEVLSSIERSYREGFDDEEKLSAIAALAQNGSEQAARYLTAFLTDMNARRKSNLTNQNDERLVRAIIPAIGRTKQSLARPALSAVEFSGWQPLVIRLAQDALKELN